VSGNDLCSINRRCRIQSIPSAFVKNAFLALSKVFRHPWSPPTGAFVVVYDDQEHVFVLPLPTMTGLTYQSKGAGSQGSSTS